MFEGVDYGLRAVSQVQFGEDVAHMRFNGLLADHERFGDFPIGASQRELSQHFLFCSPFTFDSGCKLLRAV
jgi:hypothetical protein